MTEPSTFAAHLRTLANTIEAWELPEPSSVSTFYWFVDSIEDAVTIRNVMRDPVVEAKNDDKFPAEITGILAGFPVHVFIRAAANPTVVRVQLPDLDPRLLAPHPADEDDTGPFADLSADEAACTLHEVIGCDAPECHDPHLGCSRQSVPCTDPETCDDPDCYGFTITRT